MVCLLWNYPQILNLVKGLSKYQYKEVIFYHDSFPCPINTLMVNLNRAILEALFFLGSCYVFVLMHLITSSSSLCPFYNLQNVNSLIEP